MGLYGLGEEILMDNLELIIRHRKIPQLLHFLGELIGNKFLVEEELLLMVLLLQLKLMELYGLGEETLMEI